MNLFLVTVFSQTFPVEGNLFGVLIFGELLVTKQIAFNSIIFLLLRQTPANFSL